MPKNIYNNNAIISCPLVHDELGYFYLIYKITNLVNGKIYVGKHSTKNPYDNYMGSGIAINRAIEKYGIENFSKEILFCFTDEKEAYLKEAEIVNLEFINRNDTYNMLVGGNNIGGSWSGKNNPMYGRRGENSPIFGEKNWMFGRRGENCPFFGEKVHGMESITLKKQDIKCQKRQRENMLEKRIQCMESITLKKQDIKYQIYLKVK